MALIEAFNISASRISYPKWFKFRNNADENTEYEEDFIKYREELGMGIITNLMAIPLFKETTLKLIGYAL